MQQFTDYKSEIIAPVGSTAGFSTVLGSTTQAQLNQNRTLGVTNFSGSNLLELNTQLMIYVNGSASIQVQFSPDNVNFYSEVSDDYAAGIITETPITRTTIGNCRIAIPICDKFVRISITAGSCGLTAVVGVN